MISRLATLCHGERSNAFINGLANVSIKGWRAMAVSLA
jgi:hypothetical protein